MSKTPAWVRPVGFATLLGALVLAQFSGVILGTESFYHRDFHLFGHPLAAWFRQSILAGELPLWNPLNYCGIPFLAQWNTMVLYPPNWLNLLLPLSWSLSLFCLLHLYAGGLGMYFLAARWTRNLHGAAFAGVSFAFNGLTQNCLMWPNNIAALGCLPWVLLTLPVAWRRGGGALVVGALVAALQMLSGAPEIILLTWSVVLVLGIHDMLRHVSARVRIAKRLVALGLIVTGISAAQLLPFLDLLGFSQRTAAGTPVEWSIVPGGWANFFVPLAGITERHPTGSFYHTGQHWTHSYYAGLLPWLLLAPAAGARSPRKWIIIALIPIAFILALGPAGYVYAWLNRLLPLDVIRYPVKFITLTTIALPLVGAFGLRRLLAGRTKGSLVPAALIVAGVLITVARNEFPDTATSFIGVNLKGRMLVLVAAMALLWLSTRHSPGRRNWFLLLLVLTAWLDLRTSQPHLAPTVPREQLDQAPPTWEQFAGARPGNGRVAATVDALFAELHLANTNVVAANNFTLGQNVNLIAGLAKTGGFYSLWLPWLTDAQQHLHETRNKLAPGFAEFLGVVWTLTVDPATGRTFRWRSSARAMPLVTAGQKPVVVDPDAAPEFLKSFDPRATVALPAFPDLPNEAVPEAGIDKVEIRPHRIAFTITTPEATVAVIAQADFHWWTAMADGKPIQIHRANHGFQAIIVPAGKHRIEMNYVDWSFRIGRAVSLVTLAALLAWVLRLRTIRKEAASAPLPAGSSD